MPVTLAESPTMRLKKCDKTADNRFAADFV